MNIFNSNKKGVKECFIQLLVLSIGDVKIYFSRIIEKLFSFMVICLILVIILFIFGLIIDYYRRDSYTVKRYYYRTPEQNIGGGEEYYFRYWLWQRYKKKYLESVIRNDLGITRVYSRKALRRRQNRKTRIPFLMEVYCNAK